MSTITTILEEVVPGDLVTTLEHLEEIALLELKRWALDHRAIVLVVGQEAPADASIAIDDQGRVTKRRRG
jgi:hypothetical protein